MVRIDIGVGCMTHLVETPTVRSTEPKWAQDMRRHAWDAACRLGIPDSKQEEWRYIDLTPIRSVVWKSSVKTESRASRVPGLPDVETFTLVNGWVESDQQLPIGCFRLSDPQAWMQLTPNQFALSQNTVNPFSLLNLATFTDGFYVSINPNETRKLQILLICTEDTPVTTPVRLIIEAQANSRLELHVVHDIRGKNAFENLVIDVKLGSNSVVQITHTKLPSQGYSFLYHHVEQQAGSAFHGTVIDFGSLLSRNDTQVVFNESDAVCHLSGLSLLGESETAYTRTQVNHQVGNCQSHQVFKNIVTDQAISEFNGLVYVFPGAHGTDSSQSNKNLILSDKARSFARPQLKIDADDVTCSHGSSTGQLDETEIFYLESRGLNRTMAKALLTYGFAEEVLQTQPLKWIGPYLEGELRRHLDDLHLVSDDSLV